VAFGGSNPARVTEAKVLPWDEYSDLLTRPPPVAADKASRGWSIPAEFSEPWRDAGNLLWRHALTLDFDTITRTEVKVVERALAPMAHCLYTTASHTPVAPRLRAVVPLQRRVTPDEFQAVSRRVALLIGMELASRESHVAAQMMFLPTRRPGGVFKAKRNGGNWLNPDAVLAEYGDWTDRLSWPRRQKGDAVGETDVASSPLLKAGLLGDFCRTFPIDHVIERFELPYVRVR